jgi:circadian clock protein KaiC
MTKRVRRARAAEPPARTGIAKAPTGITGFDSITEGGLPAGRPTLVCGGAGCGKTIFALGFLVHGAELFDEPGVFVAFEETAEDLAKNVASLGYDLDKLCREKRLAVDHVVVNRSEIEESGAYTLDGLFVRLDLAVRTVGAKRVVIDTLEVLFSSFTDTAILRAELRRLFEWLKDRDLTAVITAERGDGALTRHGLEEYVSDCVVLLEQKVDNLIATRRLRVVKYRGSSHGANEYPFLIDEHGVSVLPLTSVQLEYEVSSERISTGIPSLDEMLGGDGYFRTSTIMVSGSAGTGKSSVAASVIDAACRRGERCIMFALEESPAQVIRNMRSVGIDLEQWVKKKLLVIRATRPSLYGLEMHLLTMHREIERFDARVVVVDPISSLTSVGTTTDVKAMLVRLFDALKTQGVTGFMTYLASPTTAEESDIGISSLIDTWLELRDLEHNGERTRGLYVIKSRGMAHSNQVREFVIGGAGIQLVDVYAGPDGILTGSARAAEDARRAEEARSREASLAQSRLLLERKERAVRAQIAALEAELESEANAVRAEMDEQRTRAERAQAQREGAAARRSTTPGAPSRPNPKPRKGKS